MPGSASPPYETGALRELARRLAREAGPGRALVDLAVRTHSRGGADRFLAYEICRAKPGVFAAHATPRDVGALMKGMDDWCSTDCFGSFVGGVAWREGIIDDARVLSWTESEDRWVRRGALVCTVPLNLKSRGATKPGGEPARTLRICRALLDDRDPMVVKALSWALRVLARCDGAAVAEFMERHKERAPALARREVRNKLETGLKNPRRGGGTARGPTTNRSK